MSMDDAPVEEYRIDDSASWETLLVARGDIVEVHLKSTNLKTVPDMWAGVWVKQVEMLFHGDMSALAKSLGCSDADWSRCLSNNFNRRKGTLHSTFLRQSALRRGRRFHHACHKVEDFCLGRFRPALFDQLHQEADSAMGRRREAVRQKSCPRRKMARAPLRKTRASRPLGSLLARNQSQKTSQKAHPCRAPQGVHRCRAGEVKEAVGQSKTEDEAPVEKPAGHEAEAASVASSSIQPSPSPGEEDGIQALEEDADRKAKVEKDEEKRRARIKARREKKKSREQDKYDGDPERAERKALEDTKGGTTRNLQNQLVRKAAQTAKEKARKERAERKRHQKKDPSRQLALILTNAVKGKKRRDRSSDSGSSAQSEGKKKKKKKQKQKQKKKKKTKKKKKKKKKRRAKKPGDPSPGGGSSPTPSSERCSSADSGSSSDSKKRLVAPLRKKSRKKPGSFLQMLLQHA